MKRIALMIATLAAMLASAGAAEAKYTIKPVITNPQLVVYENGQAVPVTVEKTGANTYSATVTLTQTVIKQYKLIQQVIVYQTPEGKVIKQVPGSTEKVPVGTKTEGPSQANLGLKFTVAVQGNYPSVVRYSPIYVNVTYDGNKIYTYTIKPRYKVGDTFTLPPQGYIKFTAAPGSHTITITANFKSAAPWLVPSDTETATINLTVEVKKQTKEEIVGKEIKKIIKIVKPTPTPVTKPVHMVGVHMVGGLLMDVPMALAEILIYDAANATSATDGPVTKLINQYLDQYLGSISNPLYDVLSSNTVYDSKTLLDIFKTDAVAQYGLLIPILVNPIAGKMMDDNKLPNTAAMLALGSTLVVPTDIALYYALGDQVANKIAPVYGSTELTYAGAAALAVPVVTSLVGLMADKGVTAVEAIVSPIAKAVESLYAALGQLIVH